MTIATLDDDFEGPEYFTIRTAFSEPEPLQRPHPVYMSAAVIAQTKRDAWENHGRSLQVASSVVIVCADTEREAQDYFRYYVHEKGDRVAAENLVRSLFPQARDAQGNVREMPRERMDFFVTNMIAGHGAVTAVGTPEQVVEKLLAVSDAGIDLCTLGWVDFEAGIAQYVEQIHPLMVQAGLRVDEDPPPPVDLGHYPTPGPP